MIKNDAEIVENLKAMIEKNGPDYLTAEPYSVYRELTASGTSEKKLAGAILYALVSGILADMNPAMELADLSKGIQKDCSLDKPMSDRIAEVFLSLYSERNREEWKNRQREGLKQFLAEELTCTWEGFSVWEEGNGSVDCYYEAEIVLAPTAKIIENRGLAQMLEKNPLTPKDEISKYFKKSLCRYLDDKFEEDCTCDDYYPPVVEDFDAVSFVKEWENKNGFRLISCDGEGHDDGYEPHLRRRW